MVFTTELVSESAATGAVQSMFSYVIYIIWAVSLVGVYVYYDRLGVGALALPGFVLWFHWRSFENYLLWFPLFVFVAYLVGFPDENPVQLLHQRLQAGYADVLSRVPKYGSENPSPSSMKKQQ